MTKGIKPEYWDFIFEGLDPYCDMKLTDIIDLYFKNAENEAKQDKNNIRSFKRLGELKSLKSQIRREKTRKEGWLMEIAVARSTRPITFTNKQTRGILKLQYNAFIEMLRRLRCN